VSGSRDGPLTVDYEGIVAPSDRRVRRSRARPAALRCTSITCSTSCAKIAWVGGEIR
jgi:hypothetical protein